LDKYFLANIFHDTHYDDYAYQFHTCAVECFPPVCQLGGMGMQS
jgi:hypothetical protein